MRIAYGEQMTGHGAGGLSFFLEKNSESSDHFREVREKVAGTMAKSPAWQRKEGKNPEGGLNSKGRASYNKETGGNLKPPVSKEQAEKSEKSAKRRDSFCARMEGMKEKRTGSKTAKDPNSRINKALRKWDC